MKVIALILVVVSALCVIGSGVWVAVALVKSISTGRTVAQHREDGQSNDSQVNI
ncbi:MAG: hypothetical protein PVH77_06420 [Phycisphaerales bacterium]|jgi:hypothetical protein